MEKLQITREAFRMARKWVGIEKIRQIEAGVMFELYESAILNEVKNIHNTTMYNAFTESFLGDKGVPDFGSRYNQSVSLEEAEGGNRTLTWSSISRHGLLPNQKNISFVRLTLSKINIVKVELSQVKMKQNEFYNMLNPNYDEIDKANLNRWLFLEFIYNELKEIKMKNEVN